MAYYKVERWGEGAYRLTSPEAVYMELLVGRQKALLLDTGWELGPLYETVRDITDKPLVVVNSHGHVDHVNGNTQFSQEIHIHPKDMELCKAHTSPQMRQYVLAPFAENGMLPETLDRESFLQGGTGNLVPLEEGAVFDLGGKTLSVVELPGHTAGSIGLLYKEEKILFTGDTINAALMLYMPESTSLARYTQTLHKAASLPFDHMVHAHNSRIQPKEILNIYLDAAQNADWDKAQPYMENGAPKPGVRVVCRAGMSAEDRAREDFACIVISKDKLQK